MEFADLPRVSVAASDVLVLPCASVMTQRNILPSLAAFILTVSDAESQPEPEAAVQLVHASHSWLRHCQRYEATVD